jgi:hypothetical protein
LRSFEPSRPDIHTVFFGDALRRKIVERPHPFVGVNRGRE